MRLLSLRLALSLLGFAALHGQALDSQALAEDFPTRPITLMVPLAPGGGVDFDLMRPEQALLVNPLHHLAQQFQHGRKPYGVAFTRCIWR